MAYEIAVLAYQHAEKCYRLFGNTHETYPACPVCLVQGWVEKAYTHNLQPRMCHGTPMSFGIPDLVRYRQPPASVMNQSSSPTRHGDISRERSRDYHLINGQALKTRLCSMVRHSYQLLLCTPRNPATG